MVTTAFVFLKIFRAPTFLLTSLAHKTSSVIQRMVQKFLVEIACWLDFKAALAPPLLRFTTALTTGLVVVEILSNAFNAMTCLTGMTSLAAHVRILVFRIVICDRGKASACKKFWQTSHVLLSLRHWRQVFSVP